MLDAIVLGLGGAGSSAAYHLASRGRRVLGIEQFEPAHNRGSSHGDSRIIRMAYHEHPAYVPLAQRAYQLWDRLERDASAAILKRTGGLMIGPPGSHIVEGAILSANQYNLPFELLSAHELHRRFPGLNPRPDDTAFYDAAAGYLRPETAIRAHLELASRHGADLHFHERLTEWAAHESGDHVTVKTSLATYEAASLVVTPGAWAPEVLSDLRISFDVRRQVMCWFQPLYESCGFQADRFPIYIWDVDGELCFYGFPLIGDAAEGVKTAIHGGGQPCTATDIRREISESDVDEVRSCLRRFIPSLNGPLLKAATCMYTLTVDEHFVVGIHPGHPQVCLAAGFSGHGFKFTSAMGEILADLAIDGRTNHAIAFLSPGRFDRKITAAVPHL